MDDHPLINRAFRNVLLHLRNEAHLSQEALARICDISRTHISRLETCNESTTLETIQKILTGTKTSWSTFGALMEQNMANLDKKSEIHMAAEPSGPQWNEK